MTDIPETIEETTSVIETAKARRNALRAELARVERFIADYHAFETGKSPEAGSSTRLFIHGQKDAVLHRILEIAGALSEPIRPMRLARLVVDSGFGVTAKHPVPYVMTVINRNLDKFERTERGLVLNPTTRRAAQ